MNTRKILTIVLTLVMGIALTGVLATNINNVDNGGYIEYEGEQYDYLRIVSLDTDDIGIFNKNGDLIGDSGTEYIEAENVYVSDFSQNVDVNVSYGDVVLFNNNHKILDIMIEHLGASIGLDGTSNDKGFYIVASGDITDGEFTLSVIESIKPITLTLLSFVPLIFTGAIVAFVYNSKFD